MTDLDKSHGDRRDELTQELQVGIVPLCPAGTTADITFSLFAFENPNNDPQNIYGKRQFVDTDKVDLTVEFAEDGAPAQVRWFVAAFPIGNFPDGFHFPPENVIEPGSGHRYGWTFSGIDVPQGRIVGIVWDY